MVANRAHIWLVIHVTYVIYDSFVLFVKQVKHVIHLSLNLPKLPFWFLEYYI